MNITILSDAFYPTPIGIAPLMTELALDLAAMKHGVTVATCFPHYPAWSILPQYRGKFRVCEEWRGVKILRTWERVSKKGSALSKMIYYLTFGITAALGSLSWGKQDLVLIVSPPLSLSMSAYFFNLLRHTPRVLLICDLLPDAAIALGMIRNRTFIRSLYAFERWSYRQCDHIIVVSDAFRQKLIGKGVPPEKVSVIYTWVDTQFVRPLSRTNAFREKYQIGDKFVALYAGNIGLSQGLETMLEAAHLCRDKQDVLFLIVGDGTTKEALTEQAERRGLANVRFLPLQPREEMPLMYAAADVCLVLQKKNVLDINVPGKIQTIMSAGRPMIAATHPAGTPAKIISDSGCGLLIPPEDPGELAKALQQLLRAPETGIRMGQAGRHHALQNFSKEAAVRAYLEVFDKVLEREQQQAAAGPRDAA